MFNLFRRKKNNPETISERIEKDKLRLLEDLKSKGMAYLVQQMASEEDYSPLIKVNRGNDIEFDSEDTVSWHAYRQSDILKSQGDKKELLAMLINPDWTKYKQHIYRCLACICSNTNDKELFNFLIDKIQVEDDERINITILLPLSNVKKDEGYNIEPIKTLVKEGTFEESTAAIKALSNATHPGIEDLLLAEFKIGSKHTKSMICSPLETMGTAKSIPYLKEEYKKTRDSFLRWAIENAIERIELRSK